MEALLATILKHPEAPDFDGPISHNRTLVEGNDTFYGIEDGPSFGVDQFRSKFLRIF